MSTKPEHLRSASAQPRGPHRVRQQKKSPALRRRLSVGDERFPLREGIRGASIVTRAREPSLRATMDWIRHGLTLSSAGWGARDGGSSRSPLHWIRVCFCHWQH